MLQATFEQDSPFSERLSQFVRHDLAKKRLQSLAEFFLDILGKMLRTLAGQAVFGEKALARWPLLKSPLQLETAYLQSLIVGDSDDEAFVRLDLEKAAKAGLSQELLDALEYGHPDGVPPMALWASAQRRASLHAAMLAEQWMLKEADALSRTGSTRRQKLA